MVARENRGGCGYIYVHIHPYISNYIYSCVGLYPTSPFHSISISISRGGVGLQPIDILTGRIHTHIQRRKARCISTIDLQTLSRHFLFRGGAFQLRSSHLQHLAVPHDVE